jgi:hypothetical protein
MAQPAKEIVHRSEIMDEQSGLEISIAHDCDIPGSTDGEVGARMKGIVMIWQLIVDN